ncbi:EAL domain-containing protein [Paraglaciecola sp. 2405UD69-4]|uniref:EAL domain-containing protein n=1 Tax=Paraglaciecola sp. 2405UD69-4 TaxID=3391836 RepID=UPI0039C97B95
MQITEVTDSFNLDSVVPFFQPIMDLENETVWSYECLARLVNLHENTYLPSQFLFLVERQHSVAQLTETIFNRSANYFRDINMAWNINVSLSDMTDSVIQQFFCSQLQDYPNPNRISIEITAHNALTETQSFWSFSKMCASFGVKIIIDHFDLTPESLEKVIELPVSAIKVPSKLFECDEKEHLELVQQLIMSSKINNIILIAEHIEQEATLTKVKNLGLKYAQGFYFSQPKASTQ